MTSKEQEAASYDLIAEAFDRLAERYNQRYAARLCELARVGLGDSVLDLGTGTGLVARAAGSRVGGGGKVLGIDISPGMLQVAEEHGRRLGLVPHVVRFALMDAEALDLPDRSVDAAVSLFALRHLPHPERALAELRRVLRPGGRLAVGVGSGPPRRSPRGLLYRAERVRNRLAGVVGLRAEAPRQLSGLLDTHLSPGAFTGTEGKHHLSRRPADELRALVQGAGFTEARSSWEGAIDTVPTPEEFWDVQAHHCSSARYRIHAAAADEVAALRAAVLRDAHAVLDRGGSLVYPHGAAFVVARAPG